MQRFLRLIVYTNLWVGLAVCALAWLSFEELNTSNYTYLAFVFCSTIAAYNYMRIVQIPKRVDERLKQKFWMTSRFVEALVFTLFFLFLALYFFIQMFSIALVFYLSLPMVVSLLYPLGFQHPFKSFTSLRNLPGLKLILISGSWAYVSYLLPAAFSGHLLLHHYLEFVFRIFMVAALVIPFDIRDLEVDLKAMRTIPQTYGVKRAKFIAIIFAVIYLLWKAYQWNEGWIHNNLFLGWLVGIAFTIFLVARMNTKRSEWFCSFWVESVPIFAAVTLFVIQHL